jgi:hypothetical protein
MRPKTVELSWESSAWRSEQPFNTLTVSSVATTARTQGSPCGDGMVVVRRRVGASVTVRLSGIVCGPMAGEVMQLMSEYSEEEHSGAVETQSFSAQPRCRRCRVGLAEVARFRAIEVPPDNADNDTEAISIDVAYCSQCGMTLHTLGSDHAAASQALRSYETPDRGTSAQRRLASLRRRPSKLERYNKPSPFHSAGQRAFLKHAADQAIRLIVLIEPFGARGQDWLQRSGALPPWPYRRG